MTWAPMVLVVVTLLGVVYAVLTRGPWSQRAAFKRDVDAALPRTAVTSLLRDEELTALPGAVQRYVRLSGAVGEPRVVNVRVRFRGGIRKGPDARWMPFTVEQYNHFDKPSRLFFMRASLFGIPFEAFHRYVGNAASMRVKVASLITVVDARGEQMTTAETVTLLNDMCLLAPGSLVDPNITWTTVDENTVHATFVNAGHRITATLTFNDAGELDNFWSDDRWALSADGKSFEQLRWSTPVHSYQQIGTRRLPHLAEARYQRTDTSADSSHADAGYADAGYTYATFDLEEVAYNVTRR